MKRTYENYYKEYYRKNKEKLIERTGRWAKHNPKKVREMRNKWQQNAYKTSEIYRQIKRKSARDWYASNKEKAKERIKKWVKNNREKDKAYHRKAYKNNKPKYIEALKNARLTQKGQARDILNRAIRNKKIIKPSACSKCGAKEVIHGHHPDYSKPLEVIWLCSPCHGKEHLRLGRGL